MSDENTFHNPIDSDKITENPSTLPYAHTVGGAVIRPDDLKKNRSKALSAMEQQTDMQLNQIREQIEVLARQARQIEERKKLAEIIYSAKIGFKPEVNHIYHLYLKEEEQNYVLSMVGPDEWGRSTSPGEFIYSIRLLADHTWEIMV
ncbi:MAG: DUF2452 domain-containing protein [Flavobacteriales bacterium]|jgi:hypothetical protein|nr:MAG: DUF2452 domain-containing protein [Flavobacteriales bacterium]